MSNDLSFRERVERRDDTAAKSRDRSSSHVQVQIDLKGSLGTPVSVALLLRDNGLSLTAAHAAVTNLAEKGTVSVAVRPNDVDALIAALQAMGLAVRVTESSIP